MVHQGLPELIIRFDTHTLHGVLLSTYHPKNADLIISHAGTDIITLPQAGTALKIKKLLGH